MTEAILFVALMIAALVGALKYRLSKQPKRDWHPTNQTRWQPVKRQGDFELQRAESHWIDLESGDEKWERDLWTGSRLVNVALGEVVQTYKREFTHHVWM